jgi:hypothetical protein
VLKALREQQARGCDLKALQHVVLNLVAMVLKPREAPRGLKRLKTTATHMQICILMRLEIHLHSEPCPQRTTKVSLNPGDGGGLDRQWRGLRLTRILPGSRAEHPKGTCMS